jgi:hypothetical protein
LAENPLLPNAELRNLRAWTKRAANLTRKAAKSSKAMPPASEEALYAATLLQLQPGDLLVPEPGHELSIALLHSKVSTHSDEISTLQLPLAADHLPLAAGLAAGLKRAGTDRLVFAFIRSGSTSATWSEALTWAQSSELPVIFAVADPSGTEAFRPDAQNGASALTWAALQKLSSKTKIPILSVDGEDAVAVYRVTQESVLRARSGAGPAVLWAMLPRPENLRPRHRSALPPLERLEHYMRTRKISFSA